MNSLRRQAERGEITVAELRRQVAVFHDIKIEFNATMIEEGERPMEMPMEMPEQSSLFPIPEKVQRMIEGQTKEGQ
jgi:hypothetical protein